MIKNYITYYDILRNIFFLLFMIKLFSTQDFILPLKRINSSYTKYRIPKKVSINKNSILKINSNISFVGSEQTLSANIDILESSLFAAEIEIGSDNQKFNVVLDTGSQILWIPEINSSNTNENIKNFYNPKSSITSKKLDQDFEVIYGTGYCQGYFYRDNIKFLNKDKYNIIFGSANTSIFDVEGSEGIMGLARTYSQYLFSPIFTLKHNNIIKYSSFSFNYKNNNLYFYAGKPHNDFSSKNTATCNLLSKSAYEKLLWACNLEGFGLINNIYDKNDEQNVIVDTSVSVIFDTGTNIFVLPYSILESLSEKLRKFNCLIGSAEEYGIDSSFIFCFDIYKLPDISLQFGNYILILDKEKSFTRISFPLGLKAYMLNVEFEKKLDVAIIGQNFFTEFHTLFDPENKVLKFYSSNPNKIINMYDTKNNSSFSFFVLLLIIALLILMYLYIRNKRKQMVQNEIEFKEGNIQSSNYREMI